MSNEALWNPALDEARLLLGLIGMEVIVVCEHDDGEPVRRHRKRRINKKWLKRYGVYHEVLKAGQAVVFDGRLLASRKTYKRLLKAAKELGRKGWA